MDTGDVRDENQDIQLYKSSRELLPELRSRLPLLVRACGHVRYWVSNIEAEKIAKLLDRFQEWPQLLDQDLPVFVSTLAEALLEYLQRGCGSYNSSSSLEAACPLPRAVCRLLYSFCKVRGQKIIVRFFNNEARYLDLLVRTFCQWTALDGRPGVGSISSITWEEKYVLLLWLFHLMLMPFDLDTVSSYTLPEYPSQSLGLPDMLPGVSKALCIAAMMHAFSPGKERDAACALLVRIALRHDMQRYELLKSLLEMTTTAICDVSDDASTSNYRRIGAMAILAGVFKSGSENDIVRFLRTGFATLRQTVENQNSNSAARANAYTRQLLIKAVRIVLVRCLAPSVSKYLSSNLDDMIDFSIDYFVSSLGDGDTPVRVEASKSVSLCTLRLGPPDDESIVQGMIDMLGGDIRLENVSTGQPLKFSFGNDALFDLIGTSKNLEHADGLQWHGVMLALARLLLNRSLQLHLLPDVVKILISGLDFEQRSSKGAIFGTQVRDAACFGLWSLSRKYTSLELTIQNPPENSDSSHASPSNLVKRVASALIICACFDPQGNMRRGSSAALQELIGRHPDVVDRGIALVQLIDYQGVASRKRAMQKISCGVALLHQNYWFDLSRAILTWRGIGAADAVSRRVAADTLYELGLQSDSQQLLSLLERTLKMLYRLPSQGSIDKRHGLLYALSAVIDAFTEMSSTSRNIRSQDTVNAEITDQMRVSNMITSLYSDIHFGSSILGRDPSFGMSRNLLYESTSKLVGSLFSSANEGAIPSRISSQIPVIDTFIKCTITNDEETAHVILNTSEQIFRTLPENERTIVFRKLALATTSPSLGSLMTLAGAYKGTDSEAENEETISFHYQIYLHLSRYIGRESSIETRCYTWRSLRQIVVANQEGLRNKTHSRSTTRWINEIHGHLSNALDDYMTDHRGDVGSWVRLEGIKFLESLITTYSDQLKLENISSPIGSLVRMAAERLDKVRVQSWKSLAICWNTLQLGFKIEDAFFDERDVSQSQYFTQLWSRFYSSYPRQLVKGYVTSFSGGAEGLAVATRSALASFLPTQGEADIFSQAVTILTEDKQDDRYAIPSLHFIGFLLDQGLAPPSANFVKCFAKVELAHFRSANSARLEGALLCYGGLLLQPSSREKALKKVRMLQKHPQTKIRQAADEILHLYG